MKANYSRPTLTVYGTIAEVTHAGGITLTDIIAGRPTIS